MWRTPTSPLWVIRLHGDQLAQVEVLRENVRLRPAHQRIYLVTHQIIILRELEKPGSVAKPN
jgi:hypothetical protein